MKCQVAILAHIIAVGFITHSLKKYQHHSIVDTINSTFKTFIASPNLL